MSEGVLAYADVLSFYAAIERLDDPRLRARAVIVGGNPAKRGVVQSASAEALSSGVTVGMAIDTALQHCPEAAVLRTNMKRYREVSSRLHGTLREASQGIEVDGLAGAYLELGEAGSTIELTPRALAQALVERVHDEVGLPLRVGVAPVKFLARLAARESGVEGVRWIDKADVAAFLSPLSPDRLPGVGEKTRATLAEMNIITIGMLLALDPLEVEVRLGANGRRILSYARGEDESRVRTAPHPKSLSHDFTFVTPVLDRAEVESCLARLCQTAEGSLRQQHLCARRVSIKLRFVEESTSKKAKANTATRTRTLIRPILNANEMHAAALRLLDRTETGRRPLELIGIALAGLGPKPEPDAQLDLFG